MKHGAGKAARMPMVAETRGGDARSDAFIRYHRGDPDAAERVAAALAMLPEDGGLLIADATLALEARLPDALAGLEAMLVRAPDWRAGHVALAGLRWGAGEVDRFACSVEAALRVLPRHAGLWITYMDLIAEAGLNERAAETAAQLRGSGDNAALRLIEARYRGAAGDVAAASALLRDVAHDTPGVGIERARHALRLGDPEAAEAHLATLRAEAPGDRTIWALTELVWRAANDRRHAWLMPPALLSEGLDLALAAELASTLRGIHARRWPALGQSLRSGTQTRGHLADRGEVAIRAAVSDLSDAISQWRAALELPEGHPLASLSIRPTMVAAWSVRLARGGHHVPHIHPGGFVSGVLHVAADPSAAEEGALELGRPPVDYTRIPRSPIAVRPARPGRLHLFPSFLYHGTTPAAGGERLTIAFDVI